jgi:amino acid adenylation domain-containing protein
LAKENDYAYLLFTSGTTGQPKGIGVTHRNICAYLEFILFQYDYCSEDRISQAFDLTFDPSAHDVFTAWLSGSCLCVVPASSLMAPSRFIQEHKLTVWYSVPSIPMFMDNLNMLHEGRFPSLRYSMFSGEILPKTIAQKWQKAAPNSQVINYYGPTEATVNITYYNWDREISSDLCRNGGVPLGYPFPEQEIRIVDSDGQELPSGHRGELIVSGSQVASGYINNPEKTADAFQILPGEPDKTWYYTGDIAERDSNGIIYYYGRKDLQVQVLGHRVELSEIEGILKKTTGTDFVIVVPWPQNQISGHADEIVAVIGMKPDSSLAEIAIDTCKSALPSYMIPSDILFLDPFPISQNGKFDRKAITEFVRSTRSIQNGKNYE